MFEEISRGYLPESYFSDKQVYRRKPPVLQSSPYPNKIEVDLSRGYAILVKKSGAKLQDAYVWMNTHPYIMVYNTAQANASAGSDVTANIAIEAYECPENRTYAMIAFRVAMAADENTNRIMQSKGESRRGPCPAPVTGLLCRSGVNLQSVWQWLSLHRGRLAWLVDEPLISNTVAVIRRPGLQYSTYDEFNTRRTRNLQGPREPSDVSLQQYLGRQLPVNRRQSRESLDSMLPVYEPPPPSIHHSIPEDIRAELELMGSSQTEPDDACAMMTMRMMAAPGPGPGPEEPSLVSSMPPPYGEVARETEYGRSFTTHLANAIFGSSSGFVIQNAATAAAAAATTSTSAATGLLASTGRNHDTDVSASSSANAFRDTPPLTQTHTSALASPSSSTHSLNDIYSNSTGSHSDRNSDLLAGEHAEGSAMPVPFASTSRTPHAGTCSTDEASACSGYNRQHQGVLLTRTFTQSLPTLNKILSNEDAIAAVEESRRRALVTACISNSNSSTVAAAARIAGQSVAEQIIAGRIAVVPASANTAVSAATQLASLESAATRADAADGSRETAARGLHERRGAGSSAVGGISFPHEAGHSSGGQRSGGSSNAGLLRSINVHVRRSRLSAKTNPEYGSGHKKSNWLTRLLNI